MYRLLIVDDEPITVEGLHDLFQQMDQWDLDIYQAFDGLEALEIAKDLRMDIILTDIEMPEMNGIELQKNVIQLWPRCRFIFLTGYNDFEYIQATIRGGAVDFVLKTEGDEPIIAAVEKAINLITQEVTYENLIKNAKSQIELAIPSMRKDFLMDLLQGDPLSDKVIQSRLVDLSIPLSMEHPLMIVVGRIDKWREDFSNEDKSLSMYSVNNIVEEFFSEKFHVVHLTGEQNRLIWLMQPKLDSATLEMQTAHDHFNAFVLGTMEYVQAACKKYLRLVCSFVVSSEPYEWDQLSLKFDRLSLLFERGLGLGNEMLLSDEHMFASGREFSTSQVRRIRILDQYLVQKEKDRFFIQFNEIMETVGGEVALQTGLSLEIFYEMTAIFIAHMNRMNLFPVLSDKFNIGKLLSIREHDSWQEATIFFRDLAHMIFEYTDNENEQETNEVVSMINGHIETNMSGDLSLNRLSDLVYLTPFYISRLYKAKTGKSISEYITERRIERAKTLLSEGKLKIHEVGAKVGYDSAAYFTRFFKKSTTMTPQEFRDSIKRI